MTSSPIQEHWLPETQTLNWKKACWTEEQIGRVEEFFTVHPDARVIEASIVNGHSNRLKPNVQPLRCVSLASIGMSREQLSDFVDLFLRPGFSPS